jgi:hypothetical protein
MKPYAAHRDIGETDCGHREPTDFRMFYLIAIGLDTLPSPLVSGGNGLRRT